MDKYAEQTKYLMQRIYAEADDYLKYLEVMGNECAYTDRMVENVVRYAVKLAEHTHINIR